MKPEIIIQQGLKSANILLKNVQKRAAELDYLKGELVIITDANGKTFKGFFRNVEFVILDNRIAARYTVCHILECNGFIMCRKRSIPTHSERFYPPTIIAEMGLKRA